MNQPLILPSILSADFARLGEEVSALVAAGADMIHIDVMDNHYVPNLTMGPMICQSLRSYGITIPFDVHLMVTPVDPLISLFAEAGANWISFHPEAVRHVDRTIDLIHQQGCQAGLALNPATLLNVLDYTLHKLDFILLMTVNPGFGGQHFITGMENKIADVSQRIQADGRQIRLAVDGGLNRNNIRQVRQAGADTFIAGSAILGQSDYGVAITELREQINAQAS